MTTTKTKAPWLARMGCMACVAVAATMLYVACSVLEASGDPEFGVNEEGMTYGSTEGLYSGDQYPDLILVRATNGEIGYIYAADEEAASGGWVSSPEEAVAYMEERNAALSAALGEACNKRLPEEAALTGAEAAELLDVIEQGGILAQEEAVAAATLAEGPAAELGTMDELTDAYLEARESLVTYVPVYESDGKTQIGVFPIG